MFIIPIFIGTIVESYDETKRLENSVMTRKFISQILEAWKKIDQEGKGYILYHELWFFCPALMRILDEEQSLKSIMIDSFTKEKSRFLEKAKIKVI